MRARQNEWRNDERGHQQGCGHHNRRCSPLEVEVEDREQYDDGGGDDGRQSGIAIDREGAAVDDLCEPLHRDPAVTEHRVRKWVSRGDSSVLEDPSARGYLPADVAVPENR